jgi:hypothetical protein
MANLLGHKAWNRPRKCKRVGCCVRPRWTKSAQRHAEKRQWQQDWEEDTHAPHADVSLIRGKAL